MCKIINKLDFMLKLKTYSIVFLAVSIFVIAGCARDNKNQVKNNQQVKKINVMVSILPQVDFVKRIGGDKVKISAMIPPGYSPATYEPSPQQMKDLQNTDIYFRIGHIPFEKSQMLKMQNLNKKMIVINTSQGITLRKLESHSHGNEDNKDRHGEGYLGDDPHIWLSPKLVKKQAEYIYNALVELNPNDKSYFTANYNKFINDLDNLDTKLSKTFVPIKGKTVLVFHPAFGYLANDYGFEQEAIEIEGKEPNINQIKKIIDEAKKDGAKIIFVQKQFSAKSAQAIAKEINGAVIQIDPLSKDYFDNLQKMADNIVKGLNK